MRWLRSNWRAIWNPSGIPPMPEDGISPQPSASAAPIGRPRRRKAPRGWVPPSPRKSRLPFRSRRKRRQPAKRSRRLRQSLRKSSRKPRRLGLGLKLNRRRPWDAVLHPLGQVRGSGADGAATTHIALPVALTTPPGSVNHAHSDLREGTRPRRLPKRKLQLPLNVLRARLAKNPRKSPRRAFAGDTAIPGWLRGFRNLK